MTPKEMKTEIAGLAEENADLRKVNEQLLAKLTAVQSRAAPGVGAVIEPPSSDSRYTVRWSRDDLLTLDVSATVFAWPVLAAAGWKVVG